MNERYWKNKYFKEKKNHKITKSLCDNIVNLQGIALKKLNTSIQDDEEIISFRLTKLTNKHEREKGIKSNPYDYNAEIRKKTRNFISKYYSKLKDWIMAPVSFKKRALRFSIVVGIKLLVVFGGFELSPEVWKYIEVFLAFF